MNLKTARKEAGFTQRLLAQRSGVAQATISQLERGRQRNGGNYRTWEKLARVLNRSAADFFNDASKSSPGLTLAELLEPVQPATELPGGNWSPTRLADWLLCPAKGAWRTGVFDLPDDFRWPTNERAAIGKAVHRYAELRLGGLAIPDAILDVADQTVGLDPELWLPFTEAWEAKIHPNLGTPQATEQRLEAHLGEHTITVVIDAVDENGMIRDLKTTQRLPNAASIARESLQAPIYVAAWQERTGKATQFALDYLVQHKKGIEAEQIVVPVDLRSIDRVTRQLDYAAELAANPERIVANPLNKYGCNGCTFLSVCHEKFGTFLNAPPAQTVVASI